MEREWLTGEVEEQSDQDPERESPTRFISLCTSWPHGVAGSQWPYALASLAAIIFGEALYFFVV
jgi:hypothetical protein